MRKRLHVYGTLHGAALGRFCLPEIHFVHDPFSEIAAVYVALASATSIVGHKYGAPRMVVIFNITTTWPVSFFFPLSGDFCHVFLSLFSIRKLVDIVRLLCALLCPKKRRPIASPGASTARSSPCRTASSCSGPTDASRLSMRKPKI